MPRQPAEAAPAVCRAGLFQFAAGQSFTNQRVQSRGLFWWKSGRGEFVVDGAKHPLEPNDLYILPWNRCITYLPAARELLLSTTLAVSEIGCRVGQADPYHFSKLFRRHVGLTPRQYRQDHGPFSSPPRPSAHQKVPLPRGVRFGMILGREAARAREQPLSLQR